MAGRQLQSRFGHQVHIGRWRMRCGVMHGSHDRLILMRPTDRKNAREARADHVGFIAHAAGHDDTAIFGNRLTDRFERFFLRAVEKAAGVDQHHVRPGIVGGQAITVRPQLGQDALAIDQRLGTAERNHADLGRGGERCCHEAAPIGGTSGICQHHACAMRPNCTKRCPTPRKSCIPLKSSQCLSKLLHRIIGALV